MMTTNIGRGSNRSADDASVSSVQSQSPPGGGDAAKAAPVDWAKQLLPPPSPATASSPTLQSTIEGAKKKSAQVAKDHQVFLAEKVFIRSVFRLGLAIVGTAIATALTVFSCGGGVPILALSGVALTLAAGDAICAFRDWQIKKGGQGEGLPFQDDCIGNILSKLADWICHLAGRVRADEKDLDEKIKKVIIGISLGIRYGVGLSLIALGFSPIFPSVTAALPTFGSVLTWAGKMTAVAEFQLEKIFIIIHEDGYGTSVKSLKTAEVIAKDLNDKAQELCAEAQLARPEILHIIQQINLLNETLNPACLGKGKAQLIN